MAHIKAIFFPKSKELSYLTLTSLLYVEFFQLSVAQIKHRTV